MRDELDRYLDANRRHWDEAVGVHMRSELYDVESFKAGRNRLHAIERAELGDVDGLRLLHLQCHFGLDTLSWARLGADVTGVDFSAEAIRQARALADELGIDARFIESDVYALPDVLEETFDLVFTSYGALTWLYDIPAWGEIAASLIEPGGTFYVAEIHPTAMIFDETATDGWRVKYPYFFSPEPVADVSGADYADPEATIHNAENYSWVFSLGDVVQALIGAGLRIEHLHEFPYTVYQQFPFLEPTADGFWHIPEDLHQMPLLFSVKATKPKY